MNVLAMLVVSTLLMMPSGPVLAADQPHAQIAPGAADAIWKDLEAGNQRFMEGRSRTANHVAARQRLVAGQQPKVAVLACSDSRVAPEILFDQQLGELFVVRDAGNSADPVAIGSLEYAVEHLGTTMIVVLGHQSCGAVTAACSGEKMPTASTAPCATTSSAPPPRCCAKAPHCATPQPRAS